MRYTFTPPEGWSRAPFPPPQRGVYLRAPVPAPSPESASILLFDSVAPAGKLDEQLAAFARQSCEGTRTLTSGKPQPMRTRSFPALGVTVTVDVAARDEQRLFILVDAGAERLPIAFLGGGRALPLHQKALDSLLASIGEIAQDVYTQWLR